MLYHNVSTRIREFSLGWMWCNLNSIKHFIKVEYFLYVILQKLIKGDFYSRQFSNCSFDNCWQFFDNFDNCFYHFDNWKDNPGDLWHLRHWLQFWQLRTWIHDNLCYLTIKSDTGQYSQFLRCLLLIYLLTWKLNSRQKLFLLKIGMQRS